MPKLDNRKTRRHEPITRLGDIPELKIWAEAHERKAGVDNPAAEMEPPEREIVTSPQRPPIRNRAPAGFINRARHVTAGIGVNLAEDRSTVGIQFDEEKRPSRDPKNDEVTRLEVAGFRYAPRDRQWNRTDRENPVANELDARRLAEGMAREREGRSR